MNTNISGWGFSVPQGSITQDEAAAHAVEIWGEAAGRSTAITGLYRRSGVKSRHSVVIESAPGEPVHQSFYTKATTAEDRGPTTAARMKLYERDALALGVSAATIALANSGVAPSKVTHLVTVSCSGFEAPGVDIGLIQKLGLSPETARTNVGFMGCHGAFNGLRLAKSFVESDPRAVVLVCCVEICSVHQQYTSDAQQIVANALFADGAGAVVVRAGGPGVRLISQKSLVLPDTTDMMSWRVRDNGFEMTLSPGVPDQIRTHLVGWLEKWTAEIGIPLSSIKSYAVHPGGPRILGAVVESLNLPGTALDCSRSILAQYGNMSSPTVMFILNRVRETNAGWPCLALAFGPGLTIEAALFGE